MGFGSDSFRYSWDRPTTLTSDSEAGRHAGLLFLASEWNRLGSPAGCLLSFVKLMVCWQPPLKTLGHSGYGFIVGRRVPARRELPPSSVNWIRLVVSTMRSARGQKKYTIRYLTDCGEWLFREKPGHKLHPLLIPNPGRRGWPHKYVDSSKHYLLLQYWPLLHADCWCSLRCRSLAVDCRSSASHLRERRHKEGQKGPIFCLDGGLTSRCHMWWPVWLEKCGYWKVLP